MPQAWGTADPLWNFSDPAAAAFWVDRIAQQLARDSSLAGASAGAGAAVFIDDADEGSCGMTIPGNCDFSNLALGTFQRDTHVVLARVAAVLNKAGIVPILSINNRLAAATDGGGRRAKHLPPPCAVPEDELLARLEADGSEWARFYEIFPGAFYPPRPSWGPPWGDPDSYAANVANALLEAGRGIPVVLHVVAGGCPAPRRAIARPGPLGGDIEFAVAAYLVVQGPGTVLSVSEGWYDSDFCWHPEFDVDFGTPVGPAVRSGPHAWARNYTRATVTIDVSRPPPGKAPWPSGRGSVYLLA